MLSLVLGIREFRQSYFLTNLKLELIKNWFSKSQQTFIQCCQEGIQQSPLQFSVLFALRRLQEDLMTFQTID